MSGARSCFALALCLWPLATSAQDKAGAAITIRAFLNDPAHPDTKLFVHDTPESLVPLNLEPGELPAGQAALTISGRLVIFNSPTIDPENPEASVVASATFSKNITHAVAIIQPTGADKPLLYGMVLLDDSAASFAPGESRIVSFTTIPTAIQIGEHKMPVEAGKITKVPTVARLDPYNMAQTDFYYQNGKDWIAFSESKMKYLKSYRQIFICSVLPGETAPSLVTLVDDTPPAAR